MAYPEFKNVEPRYVSTALTRECFHSTANKYTDTCTCTQLNGPLSSGHRSVHFLLRPSK